MTIASLVEKYLQDNFDSFILVRVDDNFTFYYEPMDALPQIVELFNRWADANEDEYCRDPINLFNYCLAEHSFGAIMDVYYKDANGDFIHEEPDWFD